MSDRGQNASQGVPFRFEALNGDSKSKATTMQSRRQQRRKARRNLAVPDKIDAIAPWQSQSLNADGKRADGKQPKTDKESFLSALQETSSLSGIKGNGKVHLIEKHAYKVESKDVGMEAKGDVISKSNQGDAISRMTKERTRSLSSRNIEGMEIDESVSGSAGVDTLLSGNADKKVDGARVQVGPSRSSKSSHSSPLDASTSDADVHTFMLNPFEEEPPPSTATDVIFATHINMPPLPIEDTSHKLNTFFKGNVGVVGNSKPLSEWLGCIEGVTTHAVDLSRAGLTWVDALNKEEESWQMMSTTHGRKRKLIDESGHPKKLFASYTLKKGAVVDKDANMLPGLLEEDILENANNDGNAVEDTDKRGPALSVGLSADIARFRKNPIYELQVCSQWLGSGSKSEAPAGKRQTVDSQQMNGQNGDRPVCRNFKLGTCSNASCRFLHAPQQSTAQSTGVMKRGEICLHFKKHGSCRYGDQCRFSHNLSNVPCRRVVFEGECPIKDKCPFLHPVLDPTAMQALRAKMEKEDVTFHLNK